MSTVEQKRIFKGWLKSVIESDKELWSKLDTEEVTLSTSQKERDLVVNIKGDNIMVNGFSFRMSDIKEIDDRDYLRDDRKYKTEQRILKFKNARLKIIAEPTE